MEIKSTNDGLLANIEVLELLKEVRSLRGAESNSIELQHRESIEIETLKNLLGGKSGNVSSTVAMKCIADIRNLDLGLTEGEIIQILNLKPESDVEYYLIIEDCNDRLNDDQMESLKSVVSSILSTPVE